MLIEFIQRFEEITSSSEKTFEGELQVEIVEELQEWRKWETVRKKPRNIHFFQLFLLSLLFIVVAILRILCEYTHSTIVFSDEKLFTVKAVINRQNDCIIAPDISTANSSGRNIGRKAHPQSVMV